MIGETLTHYRITEKIGALDYPAWDYVTALFKSFRREHQRCLNKKKSFLP
jgi:hypothetical protein